jgi:hypothetical protein
LAEDFAEAAEWVAALIRAPGVARVSPPLEKAQMAFLKLSPEEREVFRAWLALKTDATAPGSAQPS